MQHSNQQHSFQQHPQEVFEQSNNTPNSYRNTYSLQSESEKILIKVRLVLWTAVISFQAWILVGLGAFLNVYTLPMQSNWMLYGAQFFIQSIGIWATIYLFFWYKNVAKLYAFPILITESVSILLENKYIPMWCPSIVVNKIWSIFLLIAFVSLLSSWEHLTGNDVIKNDREIIMEQVEKAWTNLNTYHNVTKIVESQGEFMAVQSYVGTYISFALIDALTVEKEVIQVNGHTLYLFSPVRAMFALSFFTLLYLIFWYSTTNNRFDNSFKGLIGNIQKKSLIIEEKIYSFLENKTSKHPAVEINQEKSMPSNPIEVHTQIFSVPTRQDNEQVITPKASKPSDKQQIIISLFQEKHIPIQVQSVLNGVRTKIFLLDRSINKTIRQDIAEELSQRLAALFFSQNPDYKIKSYKPNVLDTIYQGSPALIIDKFPTEIKPTMLKSILKKCLLEMNEYQKNSKFPPILLGLNSDGSLIMSDLYEIKHSVRQGLSGWGKGISYLQILPTLIMTSPDRLKLIICDIKGDMAGIFSDSTPFIPHLLHNEKPMIASDRLGILNLIKQVQKVVKARHKEISDNGVSDIFGLNEKKPIILLFVPELTQLFNPEKEKETESLIPEIQGILNQLLADARSAGVYLHFDSQVANINTTLKGITQCGLRYCFKTTNSAYTFLQVGKREAPTDKISVPGDFFLRDPTGQLIKGHTPFIDTNKKAHVFFLELINKRWKK